MPVSKKISKKKITKKSAIVIDDDSLDIETTPKVKKAAKRVCKKASSKKDSDVQCAVKTKKACKKTSKKIDKTSPISKPKVTRVIAKFDAGWGNCLSIRGAGGSLSWEKGVQLQSISEDEWLWEQFVDEHCVDFKILINDEVWSLGDDFQVAAGDTIVCRPTF